jgi:plastocyanin
MAHRAAYAAAVSILIWLVLPAVPAAAGGGCHLGVTQGSGTTVEMVDACFTPTVLYVDQTAKLVTFVNRSGMTHNVTANQWGHFDDILDGDAFRASFAEPGVYPFACSIHPGMSGAIVVGGGKGAGSGDAVSVEPVVIPDEPSVADPGEPAAEVVAATSPTSSNPTIGWLGGGALGLAAGVGIGLTARRRSGAERARDEA